MNSVSSKINFKSTISGQTQESDEDNTESKNDNNNETKENNESIKPTSNNENNSVIVEESDINDWRYKLIGILKISFYIFISIYFVYKSIIYKY